MSEVEERGALYPSVSVFLSVAFLSVASLSIASRDDLSEQQAP